MATIKDVALDAGVAVGTVSKVLNGQHVSVENEKKVKESVERLGYQMNYYARGLKTKYTYTIAVIVPDILNPFFACLVYYVEKELYRLGYKMFLCQSQGDVKKETFYLQLVCQNKVDGIVGITYNQTEPYLPGDIPMVTIDRRFDGISCVASDNFQGGQLAAKRLAAGGSRQLLYIRTGSHLSGETLKRGYGFEEACQEMGISYGMTDFGDDTDSFAEEEIFKYFQEHIINGQLDFDGIYTSTDGLALCVLDQLQKLDISVPKDVQLIGHDGLRRLNRGCYLVSSIAQPIEEMAKVCVQKVVKRIKKEPVEDLTILPVAFVEGGTTRPAV